MRTNAIDSIAYRTHQQYRYLVLLLDELEDDSVDTHADLIDNHFEEVNSLTTASQIREFHIREIEKIKELINTAIGLLKNNKSTSEVQEK
tara:strand:- start:343 stop:612 length:270 start_codon:yes stop_codon:yes gene_type:complete